jgi:hypothetical protein
MGLDAIFSAPRGKRLSGVQPGSWLLAKIVIPGESKSKSENTQIGSKRLKENGFLAGLGRRPASA